jgi:hypothetical protein
VRRTFLLVSAATLALAACSGTKKSAANDDLKKDLEMASSNDGLAVAPGTAGTQVVSAIERTGPAPKAPAPATRARTYHKAPTQTPAPVVAEAPATVSTPEPTPVVSAPEAPGPVVDQPVSHRPQPQVGTIPTEGGGMGGTVNRGGGSGVGSVIGAVLGAVLRGGIVVGDGDSCDPRTDGRHGGMVNRRFPGGRGTFPRY